MALEFIWIRKPLNCVKPTDYRVGVEKWGLVDKVFLNSRHPSIQRFQISFNLVKKETDHCYSDNCEYAHTSSSWTH